MMELEVGGEEFLDRCVFNSSDKVIKVTGCNFELDSEANYGRWHEDDAFPNESSSIPSPPLEMRVFTHVLSRFGLISSNNHLN